MILSCWSRSNLDLYNLLQYIMYTYVCYILISHLPWMTNPGIDIQMSATTTTVCDKHFLVAINSVTKIIYVINFNNLTLIPDVLHIHLCLDKSKKTKQKKTNAFLTYCNLYVTTVALHVWCTIIFYSLKLRVHQHKNDAVQCNTQ